MNSLRYWRQPTVARKSDNFKQLSSLRLSGPSGSVSYGGQSSQLANKVICTSLESWRQPIVAHSGEDWGERWGSNP